MSHPFPDMAEGEGESAPAPGDESGSHVGEERRTSQEHREVILPGPARELGALLGVEVPDLEAGEGLPLLWQ
ncbi:hypothetical protein ADK38_34915, partial [Streptomyces varsoviensis]